MSSARSWSSMKRSSRYLNTKTSSSLSSEPPSDPLPPSSSSSSSSLSAPARRRFLAELRVTPHPLARARGCVRRREPTRPRLGRAAYRNAPALAARGAALAAGALLGAAAGLALAGAGGAIVAVVGVVVRVVVGRGGPALLAGLGPACRPSKRHAGFLRESAGCPRAAEATPASQAGRHGGPQGARRSPYVSAIAVVRRSFRAKPALLTVLLTEHLEGHFGPPEQCKRRPTAGRRAGRRIESCRAPWGLSACASLQSVQSVQPVQLAQKAAVSAAAAASASAARPNGRQLRGI